MVTKTQNAAKRRKSLVIRILLIVFIVFAVVVILQQIGARIKANAATNMPESVSEITAMQVITQEWTPTISAVGYIHPTQGAMLSSETSGVVSRVLVTSGQQVKKGDLLVEFDSSVEIANLKASEAQLPNAKANYDRYRSLIASNSASRAEFDNAQAKYNQLVANIEAMRATIKRRQIYAPFSGVAGIVNVNVGQYITMGTEIVRVEDRSSMKVRFTLPQTNLKQISVGQKAMVDIDALPTQTFPASITAIDPAVDRKTGLINVEAVIEDGQNKLLSGMFARLNVELPTEVGQIVVPQIAVAYTMYGETVYVLQPLSDEDKEMVNKMSEQNPSFDVNKVYRVKQIEVKTASRRGNYSQLSKGVKAGDLIVTGGLQRLSNNSLVKVSDVEAVGITAPEKNSKL